MSWGSVTLNSQPCPSGYPPNCTVNTITLATTGSDAGIFTITVTVTSLPVVKGGVTISPRSAKFAIVINPPSSWFQGSNVYLGLLGVGAGKTSSASAGIGYNIHGLPSSVNFQSNGKTYSFEWESTANTNSTNRVVTTSTDVVSQNVTDTSINNYLSSCGLTCNPLILFLGVIVGIYQGFGWHINFVFFFFPC